MKGLSIARMIQVTQAGLAGAPVADMQACPADIVTDSRKVQRGSVFVALSGARVDGHDFIPQVFAAGALAVVCEHAPEDAAGPCLVVASCRDALRRLAAAYLDILAIPVVGITGSVGKTSTKEMIASVLAQKYRVHKTAGNFNNEIGLPLTVFALQEQDEIAVLEMGISDFGEMSRLAEVARPQVMVITNIGICHLENLGTRDGILKAKTEVFAYMEDDAAVVLNGDDDKLCTVTDVHGTAPLFYGMGASDGQKRTVYADAVEDHGLRGLDFDLHLPNEVRRVHVAIAGTHNVYNAMAAAGAGLALGLPADEICRGIEAARTISGRTNLIEANDYLVIDDCYNANPVSMKAALDVLAQGEGRTIAVLGDMGELGADECRLHYEVGAYAAERQIDVLFAAGTLAKELARGAAEHSTVTEVLYYETREELLDALLPFVQPQDTVLVKASHFMDYPAIVSALTAEKS